MSVSDEVLDQARMQQMEQREQEVDSMIRSNRYASAVQTALSNPPLGTKNQDIKVREKTNHNTHKSSAFAGESFGWPGTTLFVDVKKKTNAVLFFYFNNNCCDARLSIFQLIPFLSCSFLFVYFYNCCPPCLSRQGIQPSWPGH